MATSKIDIAKSIRSELILIGVQQKTIAIQCGVHPVVVNDVIFGRRSNPRIREAISLVLGKPVSEIWPEPQPEEHHA